MVPRGFITKFLNTCAQYNIPLYIISAGISSMSLNLSYLIHLDIIASVLNQYVNFKEYPNIHLYGNEMHFDKEGKLESFNRPYVHSYSKDMVRSNFRIK